MPNTTRKQTGQAFHVDVQIPPVASDLSQNVASTSIGPAGINQLGLTPEMVQQMIMSAFSAFGLQGKSWKLTPSWFVDSGASNHMTGSTDMLHGICTYEGAQHIQIANGCTLPITAVGTLGHGFSDVFVSLGLSTNLISVGQLVDANCDVHFSCGGCIVWDQVSGTMITNGPKVGRLFPLHFSIPSFMSLACTTVANKSEVWYKRLGHPNSIVLTHLMKHGHLGNKDQFLYLSLCLDCATCTLGKSKTLPFPMHGSRATKCFEIIHSNG